MKKVADEFYLFGASSPAGSRCPGPPPPKALEPPHPPPPPQPPPPQHAAHSTHNVNRLRQLLAPATPNVEKEVPDGADFLVWDTETSGIGSGDVVVQLAWAVCSEGGEVLRRYDRLWKLPPRRKIGWGAFKVHGISASRVAARGYTAATEVRAFVALVRAMRKRKLRVVAHNASFDMRMLKQTAHAHGVDDAGVDALDKRDFFCTMGAARDHCGMRNKAGRKRNPSNAELYERLLGKPPEGRLHDAFADILVTAASYAAGKRKRWW
jgi:DNA polymerase III epsilon subunit-like protein